MQRNSQFVISPFVKRKMEIAQVTAKRNGIKPFNATFETLGVFENVKIRVPDFENEELKRVPIKGESIKFISLKNPYVVTTLPAFYRCGIFVAGERVTKNYFNSSLDNFGSKVVARVEVVKKISYDPKNLGEESVIIDIHINQAIGIKPLLELKMDLPFGDFKIPNTDRFFSIKPIEKKVKSIDDTSETTKKKRFTLIKKVLV
ncbi:MAG: hypothetical protein ACOYMB_00220 [Patescibacteria group bacterium]